MPLPVDPEDPSKVKPFTDPPTQEMVNEYRRTKNKVEDNEGTAMLKKYEEDQKIEKTKLELEAKKIEED